MAALTQSEWNKLAAFAHALAARAGEKILPLFREPA